MTDPALTPRQLALLRDLIALEDAGFIQRANWAFVADGYDPGSLQVETPAVVTWEGRAYVRSAAEGEPHD